MLLEKHVVLEEEVQKKEVGLVHVKGQEVQVQKRVHVKGQEWNNFSSYL